MGRVTVSIWMSTGAMPLSARIEMRGKSVCGKDRDGEPEGEDDAGEREAQDHEQQRPPVRLDERAETIRHFSSGAGSRGSSASRTVVPSGSA